MTYDLYIKTGAEVIFYIALAALIIVLVIKKKKQIDIINKTSSQRIEDDGLK